MRLHPKKCFVAGQVFGKGAVWRQLQTDRGIGLYLSD
jgi:hypothetical protein